jgi:caffeoyl-CoA O-methyltransferase
MEKTFGQADPALRDYVERTYHPEDDVLAAVRRRSREAGLPEIQVGILDGRHLTTIAAAVRAEKAVEIGTLGGYSGICLLRGMRPGGVLHTFELDPHHAEVAEQSFRAAGFADRVRIHVGPARERLDEIAGEAPFDLVFIDADKVGYPSYLDWAARHLRPGGAVLLDNAFLFGEIIHEPKGDRAEAIAAMRRAHEQLAGSGSFIATVLPTGEGLAFGVRLG